MDSEGDQDDVDSETRPEAWPGVGWFQAHDVGVLFLFGRRPSDGRWLEVADRLEKQTLLAYYARCTRRDRGAA